MVHSHVCINFIWVKIDTTKIGDLVLTDTEEF